MIEQASVPSLVGVVSGVVRYRGGAPAAGVRVVALEQRLRSAATLGKPVRSGAGGDFEIHYARDSSVDLVVRVTGAAGRVLAQSAVLFHAGAAERVDLELDAPRPPGQTEYAVADAAVAPMLDGAALSELSAGDIALLAGKSGLPRGQVAALSAAHRLAEQTGLSPEVTYGLIRASGPGSPAGLLALPAPARDEALRHAVAAQLISRTAGAGEGRWDAVTEHLATAGGGAWGEVLATILTDPAQRIDILGRSMTALGRAGAPPRTADQFWAELGGDPRFAARVPELQRAAEFTALSGGHPPLATALLALRFDGHPATLRDLARFDVDDWARLIRSLPDPVPPSVPGDTDRIGRYAETLERIVRDAMPTRSMAWRAAADPSEPDDARAFWRNLTSIDGEVELRASSVSALLQDHPALTEGVADLDGLRDHLATTQRLLALTTRHEELRALRAAGITAAADVARLGPDAGVTALRRAIREPVRALRAYQRSELIHGMSAALTGELLPRLDIPNRYLATPDGRRVATLSALFGSLDTCSCEACASITSPAAYLVDLLTFLGDRRALPALHGRRPDLARTELTCPNTTTVLPQIDLVNEVLEDAVAPFSGPLLPGDAGTELDQRRVTDELRGAFTRAGLPLGEAAVAIVVRPGGHWYVTDHSVLYELMTVRKPRPAPLRRSGVRVVSRTYQTGASAPQLAASPEHVNTRAYDILREAAYPWSLPLDLWRVETGAYLGHAGVRRHELMADFLAPDSWAARESVPTITEYLGLTARDHALISGPAPRQPWTLWGLREQGNQASVYDAAHWDEPVVRELAWDEALVHVPVLLAHAQLGYAELVDLLGTAYVNPGRTVHIGSPNPDDQATCDVAKLVLRLPKRGFPPANRPPLGPVRPTPTFWDRLHRFTRLWRRLGWTVEETDRAVAAVGGTLDAGALVRLASLIRLRRRTGLSIEEYEALWHPLRTEGPDSPYGRLLQNPAVASPADPAFTLVNGQLPGSAPILEHAAALLAAFGLTATELAALTATTDGRLTVANISAIYRRARLSRGLGLAVADLLVLERMSGLDPFVDAVATMSLVDLVDHVVAAGLSPAEVDYLLNHASADRVGWAPSDEELSVRLAALRSELRAIAEKTTVRPDPTGDLTRATLAALGWPAELIEDAVATLTGPPDRDVLLAKLRTVVWPTFEADPVIAVSVPIPEPLAKRAYLDPATGHLSVVGVLSAADEAELTGLSADPDWRAAVRQLRAAPAAYQPPPADRLYDPATVTELLGPTMTAGDRFTAVLGRLLAYIRDAESTRAVARHVGAALGVTEAAARQLLAQVPAAGPVPATAFDALRRAAFAASNPRVAVRREAFGEQFDTMVRLVKAAWLAGTVGPVDEVVELLATWGPGTPARPVPWLPARAERAGWLGFADLTTEAVPATPQRLFAWLRLAALGRLRRALPDGNRTLAAVLRLARSGAGSVADLLTLLASRTTITAADLAALGLSYPDSFVDEVGLTRLLAGLRWAQRLGASLATTAELAAAELTVAQARTAAQLVKARYSDAGWLEVAGPLRDGLRERQRDALVAYLTAPGSPAGHWADEFALSAHVLMDVRVSACAMTSRIKQAIGSVQQFAQRCLLNLEPQVDPDPSWSLWPAMLRHYRVWEAERKIFLYPENWLEPELRDDRTAFFREAEAQLRQADLTPDVAEQVFGSYLSKLDAVHRLEVAGIAEDPDDPSTVHVIARSSGLTPAHYYRRRRHGEWSGWEPIELDISERQVLPVVWRGRLFLFWPIFADAGQTPADTSLPSTAPAAHFDIRIAWSERREGGWLPKRVARDKLTFEPPWPVDFNGYDASRPDAGRSRYRLHAQVSADGLFVSYEDPRWRTDGGPPSGAAVPGLRIVGPDGASVTGWFAAAAPPAPQPGTEIDGMDFAETAAARGRLFLATETGPQPAVATSPGAAYRLTFAHADDDLSGPLAFADDARTFWVEPTWGSGAARKPSGRPAIAIDPSRYYQFDPDRFRQPPPGRIGDVDPSPIEQYYLARGGLARQPALALSAHRADLVAAGPGTRSGGLLLRQATVAGSFAVPTQVRRYRFRTFWHPYLPELTRALHADGVVGLLGRPELQRLTASTFVTRYQPLELVLHDARHAPVENVDFDDDGAYAVYNWELFFHLPLLIAARLHSNQRFEEAHRWFSYLFDPTDSSDLADDQRFWHTRPLHDNAGQVRQRISDLITRLATGTADENLRAQVMRWREQPLNPHAIARLRLGAYQRNVVMRYLDNLIAWGDSLFRRETLESLNEATQLYALAAQVLGPRPETIAARAQPQVQTFATLQARSDRLADPVVEVEYLFTNARADSVVTTPGRRPLPPVRMLYFCVQPNDRLLGYWDTVADRLFKLRHCMNIQGVVRQLPLFEPPIDPGLLVRAAAAGMDIDAILTDAAAAPPNYRFTPLAQKADELCAEVRALGGALLTALEHSDAEQLGLLRAGHELELLRLVHDVRLQQVSEATQQIAALVAARQVPLGRWRHYQVLLGRSPQDPEEGAPVALEAPPTLTFSDEDGLRVLDRESTEQSNLTLGRDMQLVAGALEVTAGAFHALPNWVIKVSPWGVGTETVWGMANLAAVAQAGAALHRTLGTGYSVAAAQAARTAQIALRHNDWVLQNNTAAQEVMNIDAQLAAVRIRQQIVQTELRNAERQQEQSAAMNEFLSNKFTGVQLYDWMVDQIAAVYFTGYQLAVESAKRAERAFRHELGLTDSNLIRYGYWDSLKKGLLAGEALQQDLKRMEVAFLEQNRREYELTKRVSLVTVDPMALLRLRSTGSCRIVLDEALFDLDCPGHYLRRLKTVSVSIPCVAGPYTGVNATLTLERSSIRTRPELLGDAYARDSAKADPRFRDSIDGVQSMVTSGGNDDSGLFEVNLRDERFLPFEGAGAISTWTLRLPDEFRQFDYDTIADVVLNLRYTAREGGAVLAGQVVKELPAALAALPTGDGGHGLFRLFSARHDLPDAWRAFLADQGASPTLTVPLTPERFPFLFQGRPITIDHAMLVLRVAAGTATDGTPLPELAYALAVSLSPPGGQPRPFTASPTLKGAPSAEFSVPGRGLPDEWRVTVSRDQVSRLDPALLTSDGRLNPAVLRDLYLLVHYNVASTPSDNP